MTTKIYGEGLDPEDGIKSCQKLIDNEGACEVRGNYVSCQDCPGAGMYNQNESCKCNGFKSYSLFRKDPDTVKHAQAYIDYHSEPETPMPTYGGASNLVDTELSTNEADYFEHHTASTEPEEEHQRVTELHESFEAAAARVHRLRKELTAAIYDRNIAQAAYKAADRKAKELSK